MSGTILSTKKQKNMLKIDLNVYRIEKVAPASPAGHAGLKNLDYLVKVNGKEVFDMNHNELVSIP